VKLLAIESAFEPCSVALYRDGAVVAERVHDEPRGHAERLLPFVSDVLRESGLDLGELDAIAFSRGPGSFTSLRIGIGVVQGLAFGADLPVVGVSSLQAVAQAALPRGVTRACVAMDARMDEVYAGCFERDGDLMRPVDAERVCAPAAALPARPEAWTGVGNGFARFEVLASAPMAGVEADIWPRAADVAVLAARRLASAPALSAAEAQPVYLRDRVAEKPRDRGA